VTAAKTGRWVVDTADRIRELDEHGLGVAMGYLLGASVSSIAVRRAITGALDAADTDARQRAGNPIEVDR
jgi:hypothetical protein